MGNGDKNLRDLDFVLSNLTGRRLTVRSIYTALGMPKATYYSQRDGGRLHQPENLLQLARAFDVNPVGLLVEYGHLTDEDVVDYLRHGPSPETTSPTPIQNPSEFVIKDVEEFHSPKVPTQVATTPFEAGTDDPQRQVVLEMPITLSGGSPDQLLDALRQIVDQREHDEKRITSSPAQSG